MRGYAAIAGVFWQKRWFPPDRGTLGSNPCHFRFDGPGAGSNSARC